MADETSGSARLAVLIDADNARPSVVEGLLAEVAKYGVAGVRRIHGDLSRLPIGRTSACLAHPQPFHPASHHGQCIGPRPHTFCSRHTGREGPSTTA